jgi:formate dehydrogenase major subunit
MIKQEWTGLSGETSIMDISRRALLRGAGGGIGVTALGALGFGGLEQALAADIRPYRLARTVQTRNTCPYCAVACGIIMYAPQAVAGAQRELVHIEGDPDHPTNRGTLCPKGAALLDFVRAPTRTKVPLHRAANSSEFKEVTWDLALDRIATLMKADRDKNFIAKNADGATVNRWLSTGFLAASATTNETAFLTFKAVRAAGMVVFDNQARV